MSTQQFSSAGVDPATGPGEEGDCGWRTAFPTMASKSSLFSDFLPRGFRNEDAFQEFIRLQVTVPVFFKSFTLMITTSRHLLTSQCWSSMPGGGHGLGCDWEPGPEGVCSLQKDGGRGARDSRLDTDSHDPVYHSPAQQGAP